MNMNDWNWLNESRIICEGDEVVIHAPGYTDWFNNPVPENGILSAPVANAPFFYCFSSCYHRKTNPSPVCKYQRGAIFILRNILLLAL